MSPRVVPIRDDSIRLAQFLKLAHAAGSGSDAKALCATDRVEVNGELERRRGRQLHRGDRVSVDGTELEVG